MNTTGFYQSNFNLSQQGKFESQAMAKTFLSGVFSWMAVALAITSVVAYLFAANQEYMQLLANERGLTVFGYIVMFAPIGFVLIMSMGFQRLSSTALLALFLVYSVIMGMSLSFIFLIYTQSSIFQTFAIAAGMFGLMAFLGFTTNTDLTKFGSIMLMGLFGIIIAGLINMFLKSSGLDYIISFVGVLVFTGLTAYDVQKLKRIGTGVEFGMEATSKLSVMGALTLYLDFINLFLMLLRFFGNRRD